MVPLVEEAVGVEFFEGLARSGEFVKSGEGGGVRGSGAEAGGRRCQKVCKKGPNYKFFSRFARIIPLRSQQFC